ncbi:putative Ig domain-containing protein [Leucobacter chromiiresistens]|uniref:putative Ig domain-containing protein n=1 Tax=Leucobacter chromiiresistens TaxID=1079994 RepID=UPI0009EBE70D|nr:putative Ig domain-containing protein [Leucobacter chromiiresistens]
MLSSFRVPRARTNRLRSRAGRAIAIAATAAVAFSGLVIGSAEPAAAAVENIQFETPNNNLVTLGDLASRSQRGPVSISGIGPYTVRGTDAKSGQPYEFVTDWNYSATNIGWQRESDERASSMTFGSATNVPFLGRTGALQLTSGGSCNNNNTFGGLTTYCSAFGPEVYSQPFTATDGQAVSFDWAAQRVSDDYEIYAYLVRVDGQGYGTPADHTLIAYGRGGTQNWTTSSKKIPADGTYRFRFVNGTYDQTGGFAIGSNMYIDNVLKLGQANPIDFGQLSDRVVADGPLTVSATAPGGAVTFSTSTTSICAVNGSTVTFTGNVGTCTIVANQAGGGEYVPAETTPQSFRVLAARTAPVNAGAPFMTGAASEGDTISFNEGTWLDGGSPITATRVQWTQSVNGGPATPIAGATGDSCYLVDSPGSQLRVSVTKVNAIGETTSVSTPLNGFVCGAPAAPVWTPQSLGDPIAGNAVSVTFTASGATKPTYSVVDGALPAGLALNAATGVVSGTPTEAGAYSFTLRATNPTGTADLEVSGTVNAAPGAITGAPDAFVVGEPAAGAVAATGTPAPSFTVTAGALPAGVTLDPATGAFTGTPTTAGEYAFTVTASNGIGTATTREFTGTVEEAPNWSIAVGWAPEVGEALDVTFTATGTPAPTYSISAGALPAGLTLDAATGRISGTPTEAGPYSFVILATNTQGTQGLNVSGTVVAAPGAITGDPGHWIVGAGATGTLQAAGTPAPVYLVTAGELPQGVSLNPITGAFSGSPTTAGEYAFTVTATNGVGADATREFSGVVDQAPVWNAHEGLALQTGVDVSTTFTASGTPTPTYSILAGSLPEGLTLNETTGEITGTPTAPGSYSVTLGASNGIGDPVPLELTGVVTDAPVWVDRTIGDLRVGAAFTDGVFAQGTPAATYSVTSGTLPAGLSLNELTGAITGTPTQSGAFAFTITASNGVGEAIAQEFTGTVVKSPVQTPGSTVKLPQLQQGTYVEVDLSEGVDSDPAPTYLVTSGALPEGLSLDPVTGILSGTPLHEGPYSFIITVDNGTGELLTFAFEGYVDAADAAAPAPAAPGDAAAPAGNGTGSGGGLVATGADAAPAALLGGALLLMGGLVGGLALALRRRRVG